MKTRLSFNQVVLGVGALIFIALSPAWAQTYSHARIVRLSFEEGTVTLVRPDAPGGVSAAVNTPIEEGFKLGTSQDSFAEVEFENTSTARIGQLSELDFNQLALDSSGGKLNGMELRQGYATLTVIPEDGDVYEVKAGDATVTLAGEKATRFRVDVESGDVRVEVFKGAVEVSSPYGTERLTKNNVFELHPGADQPVTVARGITKDAWDEWVEERENQAQLARRKSPPGLYTNDVSSLLYGWNDLYYYGSWANIPGYGYGWVPAIGYGWTPYSFGQWVWYPGFGYTWISFEPWGWVPFHYGGWIYQASFGWCWIPGGFNSWSPGLVSWFQGPGWVAWTPRSPRPRPGGQPIVRGSSCATGDSCATVVSTESFRAGSPVPGHRLPTVAVTGAFAVDRPDVRPGELGVSGFTEAGARESISGAAVPAQPSRVSTSGDAALAGRGIRPAASPSRSRMSAPAQSGAGFRTAGAATEGRVIFDPTEGRFVNGAPRLAEPGKAEAARPAAGAPAETLGVQEPLGSESPSSRSAPASAHETPGFRAAFAGEHHASPRMGMAPSRSTGTFERTLNSWGVGTSGGQFSHAESPRSSSGSWPTRSSASSGSFGGNRSGGVVGVSGGGGARSAPSSSGGSPHR